MCIVAEEPGMNFGTQQGRGVVWRGGSVVKNMCCSCGGLGFLATTSGRSQPPVTPAPRDGPEALF